MPDNKNIDELNFEASLNELENVVRKLESGQASLDDSIALYETGMLLKRRCEQKLKEARTRIEKITMDKNGTLAIEPFESKE